MKNKRLSRLVPETPGGGLTGLGRGALRVTNLAGQHPGKETPVPRAKSQQAALPAPADPPHQSQFSSHCLTSSLCPLLSTPTMSLLSFLGPS